MAEVLPLTNIFLLGIGLCSGYKHLLNLLKNTFHTGTSVMDISLYLFNA